MDEINQTTNDEFQPVEEETPAGPEKKNRKKLVLICLTLLVLAFGGWELFIFQRTESFTYELGQNVSTEVNDYLLGRPWRLADVSLDLSKVNQKAAGSYKATCTLEAKTWTFTVNIVDTTAPELVLTEGMYAAKDRDYTADAFINEAYDISGEVETGFITDEAGSKAETLNFDQLGTENITVYALDMNGNQAEATIDITIDTAPVFIGQHDLDFYLGQEVLVDDYISYMVAYDDVDKILTDGIQVDYSQVNLDEPGQYQIHFYVTDNNNLTTETVSTVNVFESKAEAQQASLEQIETTGGGNITSEEIEKLDEAGFFTYQPLNEENLDAAEELIYPTLIDLIHNYESGNGYVFGSGCIYDITPDYIYFLSVTHVLKEMTSTCVITFYDDISIEYDGLKYVEEKSTNEVAMFKMPTDRVPCCTLLKLKEIYFDQSIYDEISVGDPIIGYAANWQGSKDLIKTGTISNTQSASGMSIADNCIASTDISLKSGMSGTAITDYRGRLIALCSNYHFETGKGTTEYGVRLDALDTVLQKLEALE